MTRVNTLRVFWVIVMRLGKRSSIVKTVGPLLLGCGSNCVKDTGGWLQRIALSAGCSASQDSVSYLYCRERVNCSPLF